jgi:molybdopterin converting factor small subunit
MRVTVQLFARLRELAGRDIWECDVAPGSTAGDVWRLLADTYPAVAPLGPAVSCAVNADFTPMTAAVHEGDDVAFLPPVSGGSGVRRAS